MYVLHARIYDIARESSFYGDANKESVFNFFVLPPHKTAKASESKPTLPESNERESRELTSKYRAWNILVDNFSPSFKNKSKKRVA